MANNSRAARIAEKLQQIKDPWLLYQLERFIDNIFVLQKEEDD